MCPGVIEVQVELALRHLSHHLTALCDHTTTVPPHLKGLLHRVKFCTLAMTFVTRADPMTRQMPPRLYPTPGASQDAGRAESSGWFSRGIPLPGAF